MISVGTTDGLRANVEETLFNLRIKPRQSSKKAIAGFELLDGYRCVFGLQVSQVIVFAVRLRFDFSLEIALNLLFVLLLAVHFALVVAFAVRNLRGIVVDEVHSHYLGWRSLINGQQA